MNPTVMRNTSGWGSTSEAEAILTRGGLGEALGGLCNEQARVGRAPSYCRPNDVVSTLTQAQNRPMLAGLVAAKRALIGLREATRWGS